MLNFNNLIHNNIFLPPDLEKEGNKKNRPLPVSEGMNVQ